MALPLYDVNITLEEALEQFDYATSQLVLHPLNEKKGDIRKRRAHILEAATDANNASSRLMVVLERGHQMEKLTQNLANRYLRDIGNCMEVLSLTKDWYRRIEKREIASNTESEEIVRIKRERNIIGSYIDLMRVRSGIVNSMVNGRKNY